MKNHPFITAAIALGMSFIGAIPAEAGTTYLILGTWTQGVGGKPIVYESSSPNLTVIPMESIEQCEATGSKIMKDIYKPIWRFDGRWTCIEGK